MKGDEMTAGTRKKNTTAGKQKNRYFDFDLPSLDIDLKDIEFETFDDIKFEPIEALEFEDIDFAVEDLSIEPMDDLHIDTSDLDFNIEIPSIDTELTA